MVFSSAQLSKSISSNEENELFEDFVVSHQNDEPQLFAQAQLNDLTKGLDLPKCSAELVGPQLKEKNMLAPETKITVTRKKVL